MNLLKMYNTYRQLMKNQWLDHQQIRDIQELKFRSVISHAYENVPFYKRLFDEAKISPVDIKSIEDLNSIPVTKKSDLQAFGTEFIISRAFRPKDLKLERTSGSTGKPLTMHFDRNFVLARDALFLRALRTAGYRPGQKLLLITSDSSGKHNRRFYRWRYASILQSPETHLMCLNRFKPDILYGCTTSLRQLAKHIQKANKPAYRLKKIITAAETLDKPTRNFLEETFDAELFDFYGLTEMGIVGWECSEHKGYHLAEDSTIIEYLPDDNSGNYLKLVMTNLNLMSMPFIRFETGDITGPRRSETCPCGRGFPLLQSVEGRVVDCVQLKNGETISPYRLTCALEKLPGIIRYQVIQKDYDKFTVKVETGGRDVDVVDKEIRKIMHSVLGQEISVAVLKDANIDSTPGKKFRVIESELGNM